MFPWIISGIMMATIFFGASYLNRRSIVRPRLGYLVMAVPLLVGVILDIRDWSQYIRAAGREKTAWGVVIGHETAYHERYEYLFQIGGQSYTGWHGNECKPDVLVVGQKVEVIYDPTNPRISDLCSFSVLTKNTIGSLLPQLGAIVLIVFFSVRKRPIHVAEEASR